MNSQIVASSCSIISILFADIMLLIDTAYILSFSLIMLNTDAHNPNVKTKMSLKDFLRNNRGINNQKDLPEDFLKKLYYNIVNNEIKMHDEAEERRKFEDLMSKMVGKIEASRLNGECFR
jgi:Sec7-like guanine-nucleotide exchange factor